MVINMSGTKYCMGCMQALPWDGRCRFCNFTEAEYECDASYLPLHSTLKDGAYLIGRVLGKGGFGITYIGLDTTLLQRVAIKEFYPEQLVRRNEQDGSREVVPVREMHKESFERGMDSFLQEGRMLAKFSRLNAVAGVRTFLQENKTAYLVMEYVDGRSVKDYVHTFGVMEPDVVLTMIKPMIRDLQRIHEEHIFHRDISPDNLIIDTNGKLTLIDFGAAKQILSDNQGTNTILYKQGYSTLEQYSANAKQGAWTDVYGLCVSVYYMLTGIVPESAMERIVDDNMQPLCDMEALALPEKIKAAVWRGMAVERRNRYQNMAELYQALFGEQISEVLPMSVKEVDIPLRQRPYGGREKVLSRTRMKQQLMEVSGKRRRRSRQRGWMLGGAAVILLVLAVTLWQAGRGRYPLKTAGPGGSQRERPVAGTGEPVSEAMPESTAVDQQKRNGKQSSEPENQPNGKQSSEPESQSNGNQSSEPESQPNGKRSSEPENQSNGKQSSEPKNQPNGKQSSKPNSQRETKGKQTPKPDVRQTPGPDTREKKPVLKLPEDDHVAGDLDVLE